MLQSANDVQVVVLVGTFEARTRITKSCVRVKHGNVPETCQTRKRARDVSDMARLCQ